jgi:hypothetical protein
MMIGKLNAGRQLNAMLANLKLIVCLVILIVAPSNVKLYYIGRTTLQSCKIFEIFFSYSVLGLYELKKQYKMNILTKVFTKHKKATAIPSGSGYSLTPS